MKRTNLLLGILLFTHLAAVAQQNETVGKSPWGPDDEIGTRAYLSAC